MSFYVDVILPIPVNQKFTYLISEEEYHFIKPGMRIIVPFGKSKLYTSVSYKTHNDDHNDSDFEFKSIIQIIDDFLDYSGSEKKIGKKTGKDKKKGKATLISLLGYKNAVKYSSYLKNRIISSLSKYKSKDLIETVEFVINRKK